MRLLVACVAAVALVALSGCQASTQIAGAEAANGTGVVRVTITLDPSALAALGGQTALAAQLQDADLVAAGWAITGPRAGPASATVVIAAHAFASPAEASTLVEELAGSGAASQRPFRLTLVQRRNFWRTDTTLTGTVDLTCGLACFGDSGAHPRPGVYDRGESGPADPRRRSATGPGVHLLHPDPPPRVAGSQRCGR